MEKQQSLFGAMSLNPVGELKRAMSLAVRKSGLTRAQIAERMTVLLAVEGLRTRGKNGVVNETMVDKWLAPEALESYPNLTFLVVFCKAAGSLSPLQALAGPLGGRVIGPQEIVVLEFGLAQVEGKKIQRKSRRLAEQIEEMGR